MSAADCRRGCSLAGIFRSSNAPKRYLERDHEQLAELCQQRDQLEQKLLFEQSGTDDSEQARRKEQDQDVDKEEATEQEHDPEFQIFVEKFTGSGRKTVVLMVRSTTTVKEVKEKLEKKGGIPAGKQKLRTRGGKFLHQQDLSLKESCVGRQATLVMCPLMS